MKHSQALKKTRRYVIKRYRDADTCCWINTDDKDLQPIKIPLPELPDWSKIDGWLLEPEDQVFKIEEYPKRLKQLEYRIRGEIKKDLSIKSISKQKKEFPPRMWEFLNNNQEAYHEEITWIEKQWYHRIHGYWFFCNGQPTYINGWNWGYLNYCHLEGRSIGRGLPEYRDRDRKWFHAQLYFYNDTTTPVYVEQVKEGKKVREPHVQGDGSFKLDDNGGRTVLGTINLKPRRVGETSKAQWINIDLSTRSIEFHGGIQGDTDATGSSVFAHQYIFPYKKLPWFFLPESDSGMNPKKEINFNNVADEGLGSWVDFATTAHRSFYDGTKLKYYHNDEGGKCLGFNELVKMHDGSVKNVQDINVGEFLMGMDGTKRKVLNKYIGNGELYKIIPNKGKPWVCNSNHILTLKSCLSQSKIFGKNKGEVIDVPIEEYLSANDNQQRHTVLFRGISKYKKNKHELDPYLLGLYLGDGGINSGKIYNVDKEVIDYLQYYCDNNDFILRKDDYIGYTISSNRNRHGKQFRNFLRNIDVYTRKDIPDSYLYDSRKNRLELLAGLLDTDGYLEIRNGKPHYYEIAQVRKELSYKILDLARGLGFYASLNKKKTSMKRKDGSYFRGEAYRVCIYGDLYKIPCKIKRKKAWKCKFSNNRRNPMHSGFSIEKNGAGNYCGLEVDGDNRFMLDDYTVVHNCRLEDSAARHLVVKKAMMEGSTFIGFMVYTSTVDEMSGDAGQNFFDLCQDSHYAAPQPYDRDSNGRTKSGLINVFFSAYEGLAGYVGKFGESIIEDPTEDQIPYVTEKTKIKGRVIGAKEYLENEREKYRRSGEFDKLSEEKRQFPMTYRECFTPPAKNTFWNVAILEQREQELKFEFDPTRRGNFEWSEGFGSPVVFIDNREGRFVVSKMLQLEANQFKRTGGIYYPLNPDKFVASADAFRFEQTQGTRQSDGGGAVKWLRDLDVDSDEKAIEFWDSDDIICTYKFRPSGRKAYAEDMLKMCVYYGAMMYPENNVTVIQDNFIDWGYRGYLLYDIDPNTGKRNVNSGFNSLQRSKEKLFTLTAEHISKHGHKYKHRDYIEEALAIKGMEDMKNWDLFTAVGGTHLASESRMKEMLAKKQRQRIDLTMLQIPGVHPDSWKELR